MKIPVEAKVICETGEMEYAYMEVSVEQLRDAFLELYRRDTLPRKEAAPNPPAT